MSEFTTESKITATIDRGSLRDARSTLEDELSSDPITVDVSSGMMADGGRAGGRPLTDVRDSTASLVTLADDRNTLLGELLDVLETQAFESAQQSGDGGIGIAGTTLGGGGLVGGATTVGGAVASALTSGPPVGGGGGLGVPAIGPKLAQAFDQISEDIGGGGFLPDGNGGSGGTGTAPSPTATPLMAGPNIEQLLSWEFPEPPSLPTLEWPTPPDPLADTSWPTAPDPFADTGWPTAPDPFADTGWPTAPEPFADTGWPTSPDPFADTAWPSSPDPFAGTSWPTSPDPFAGAEWPSAPDPFAQGDWPEPPDPLEGISWPEPPDPFQGITWPDPPDPFRGFDWPDPPDLEIGVEVQFSKQRLARKLESVLNDFERRLQNSLGG